MLLIGLWDFLVNWGRLCLLSVVVGAPLSLRTLVLICLSFIGSLSSLIWASHSDPRHFSLEVLHFLNGVFLAKFFHKLVMFACKLLDLLMIVGVNSDCFVESWLESEPSVLENSVHLDILIIQLYSWRLRRSSFLFVLIWDYCSDGALRPWDDRIFWHGHFRHDGADSRDATLFGSWDDWDDCRLCSVRGFRYFQWDTCLPGGLPHTIRIKIVCCRSILTFFDHFKDLFDLLLMIFFILIQVILFFHLLWDWCLNWAKGILFYWNITAQIRCLICHIPVILRCHIKGSCAWPRHAPFPRVRMMPIDQ